MSSHTSKKLSVDTSGMADHIRVQLRAQGYRLPLHTTASLERTRWAIIQLRMTGILNGALADMAGRKFLKIVATCIRRGY